ncbi:NAD(P)-dependent oxidoreductase [Egibacter rhizosphaerae]|uniref:NAD(P)-dependent oxidoreductase n=1 Tax=Egibacter rhizosphaerae TaxID=1670831 RepID=A0A411YAF1_9ACTN|nr:NAD(P)-dependent oxidoreductase [Egibacter rhizosphaerae]QBI18181.1 NAD(P)-dependent oxidoreductase [Egibacter rhizosphaerae]
MAVDSGRGDRVGWVGTGVMGAPMAGHLLDAGHPTAVHTRTRERAQDLLDGGAAWATSPAEAARDADVVGVMVGSPQDVREVVLGDDGVLAGASQGAVLIDFTTSDPRLSQEVHAAAAEQGVAALDAPVSGGDVGAREARLSIMVGGDAETFARARPLLERLGRSVVLQGPPGAGQHTKIVNQLLIAGIMLGLGEGLVYAVRAGLDPGRVMESVAGGAAGSWSLDTYGPRMLEGDFDPGFAIEHYTKDLRIARSTADELGIPAGAAAQAAELYESLDERGFGDRGIHALVLELCRRAGVTWPGGPGE